MMLFVSTEDTGIQTSQTGDLQSYFSLLWVFYGRVIASDTRGRGFESIHHLIF